MLAGLVLSVFTRISTPLVTLPAGCCYGYGSTDFIVYLATLFLKFAIARGLSGGRGEMAMAVASHARLVFFVVRSAPVVRRTPDAFPFWSLYSDGPLSSL